MANGAVVLIDISGLSSLDEISALINTTLVENPDLHFAGFGAAGPCSCVILQQDPPTSTMTLAETSAMIAARAQA